MIKQLAIETSTEAFSIAVSCLDSEAKPTIFSHYEIAPRQHGRLMLTTIERLLSESQLSLSQIDQVVYGRGPGAFTGVRIAVSAAQGLALSQNKPLIGISSLENIAYQAFLNSEAEYAICAMDARISEIYYAVYQRPSASEESIRIVVEEQVIAPDLVETEQLAGLNSANAIAVGSGWSEYQEALSLRLKSHYGDVIADIFPSAEAALALASNPDHQLKLHTSEQAVPIYLRNNVAKKSQKKPMF